MIRLTDVSFRYDAEGESGGVTGVSLRATPGECVVLCGPSGCGKTTLLRLISGLAPGQYAGNLAGEVLVNGRPPQGLSSEEKARTIGMVFQDPRSQFFMSAVREELAFSGENLGVPRAGLRALVEAQAAKLGITHLLDSSLNQLSSGQKQKIAIASAGLLAPPVLLLDEPSANLDAGGAAELVESLLAIKAKGAAIVICEHRLHEFLPVADRYICIENGRITRQWSRAEFAALPPEEAARHGLRHPALAAEFCALAPPAVESGAAFRVENLSYRYKNGGGFAGVSALLQPGGVAAITGSNGAGKTTFCKALCGLLRPGSGGVYKAGRRLGTARRRQQSYFVMQDADYQLFTDSVGNELVLGHTVTDALREKAYAAMELFHLTALKDRHPASLSGGEKQRVTLAAAWCSGAELIVLDEPTSGLDAANARRVALYMKALAERGKAVLVITHDPLLVAVADRQIALKMG